MAQFDRLNNQQGWGESDTPTGAVSDEYGDGASPTDRIDQDYGDATLYDGRVNDGYGNYPQPSADYVELIRKEAARAGVKLPESDLEAVKLAARAAIEAQ